MIDQYNMDQYNKETSQIHAPADLIRRTKEAVREEEQRIAGERLQQNTMAKPKHSYGKVYRWALPVAAAVLCVILYNISGMMPDRNMSGSGSGSAADMDSVAAQLNDSGMGAQSGGIDTSESMVTAAAAEEESVIEDSEYEIAATDTVGEEYASEDYDDGQLDAAAASAESDVLMSGSVENNSRGESGLDRGKNSYIESIYGSDLWLEEVKEVPAIYNNPDTKHVTIRGVELYVGKDSDETWIAYAETDAGKYMIGTELTEEEIDQEAFTQAAYEMLAETIGITN